MTQTKTTNVNNRNTAGNIIWFNPPYSQNVKSNIGKTIKIKFKQSFKFHDIFLKNLNFVSLQRYMNSILKLVTSDLSIKKSSMLVPAKSEICNVTSEIVIQPKKKI